MERVRNNPEVILSTSMQPGFSCAIGMVSIKGKKAADFENFLFDKFKIHSVAIDWENLHGVRITPNVYTSTKDLDLLVDGIEAFAKTR